MAQSTLRLARLTQQVLAPAACSEAPVDTRPFAGVRVVDCTSVVAGPTACALLADMGADVIKIEPPGAPDITRGWGNGDDPGRTAMPDLQRQGQGGSCFVQCNRGKRSMVMDIGKPQGVALLKRLLATADVFVTNIRLRSLQKLGLDYETLAPQFPALVCAHLSAFGRTGPNVHNPGYDIGVWWANSGLMDLARTSEDADMPRFPGAMGDNSTAVQLAGFIGTALFQRERTGKGQLVDAALFRSGIFATAHPLTSWAGGNGWGTGDMKTGGVRGSAKLGERATMLADAPFRCKDGVWLQLLGIDVGRHMGKVLRSLGLRREDLTPGATSWDLVDWRVATSVVDAKIAARPFAEWEHIFAKHDVWYARVQRFEETWDNEQAQASGIFVQPPGVQHKLLGSPVLLGNMAGRVPTAGAPAFGQHTQPLLREIGVGEEEEARLRQEGIVK